MVENIPALNGTVGEQVTAGTMAKGEIISISTGIASDFMTEDQCMARKTLPETRYINIEIGIAGYGVKNKSFPDYSDPNDGSVPINPNSIHGRVISTYPVLSVGSEVNMLASEKANGQNKLIVWDMVLV